jgi:hypothetical protein
MAKGDVFRRAGIVKRFCEMFVPLGAVMCAVVCLGLPVVSGTLGVAGMDVLRDDRLLIPFEVLCCVACLWTFERGRQVHGVHPSMARIRSSRNAPGIDVPYGHSLRSRRAVRMYRSDSGDGTQSSISKEMLLHP